MASVITQLGNNFAATEAQILENATEIQKGISIYEASAESVLGLGAATSALGSEAESSRSAIMTTFKVIDKAISTGANLEQVLKLTGLTQKELSAQFNKDATGVFVKFVGGLSKAKEEGQNLNNILDDINITEKRATTVIGALAANYNILKDSVSQATLEYHENLALNKEVAAASESISSIIGDVKDKWDAYRLSTNEASGGTQKIANTLKYLRDNLGGIIDNFIKYGSVLLAYFGIMKLVNFAMTSFTAIKTAAAAAELSFALATGIGRKAVIVQATAVRAATVAQTGLNTAMAATPWGIIIALVAAAAVAYKVFGNQLSDTEKVQNRINVNISKKKKELEDEAKTKEELYNKNIKQIEEEYKLKKAKQGASKKLDTEEIEAKKKLIQTEIDKNDKTIELNKKALVDAKKTSEGKIKVLENELIELERIERKSGGSVGIIVAKDKTQKKLDNLKVANTKQIKDLELTNQALLNENKKYLKSKEDLEKESTLIITDEERELSEKRRTVFLEAQKKLRKELYEAEKKANDDAFKLSQFRLQREIDINNKIIEDEKSTLDEKLTALDVANQKMLQKSKEGLENELQQLGKYDEDSGKFVRQLSDIEIAEFIKTGELKKTLTAEQQLLYEKYQLALTEIATTEEKKRQTIIDNELNALQKRIDAELQLKENDLNKELVKENDRYSSELEAAQGNFKLIEKAREDHEKRVLAIQKRYALEELNIQIANLEKILEDQKTKTEGERISAEEIAKIITDLERFKRKAYDLSINYKAENLAKDIDLQKEFNERVKDLAFQMKDALVDLTNAIFDARIQRIDDDIKRSEEYYNKQLELAGDDENKKKLIQNEAEKEREKLEAKKRKEQQKQAIFNKIANLATIAMNTAVAYTKALAQGGFILGIPMGTVILALGALQAATVLAQPIPKYKHGRKKGPEEIAITGDGGVREVVTDKFGNNPRLTPSTPTLTFLNKDDQVHRSVEEYYKLQRAAMMSSLAMEGKKMSDYQARQLFDDSLDKDRLDIMKDTLKAIQRQKTVILNNKIDIPHSIWKSKNINWD